MVADIELAGIIADNHGVGQEAMGFDAAPQRSFGSDRHRIGSDFKAGDAELFEMGVPGRLIRKGAVGMFRQAVDHRGGQRTFAHVGERLVIDDVIVVAGAQQRKEVEAAFGGGGAEPGEKVVANLSAVAVGGFVARAGVVRRDPGGAGKSRPQHLAALLAKAVLSTGRRLADVKQAHHLALVDDDADAAQQRHQSRHRGLPLMILSKHEAAKLRPVMAINARGKRSRYHPPIRRLPALAPELHHMRTDIEILHHKARVSFEPPVGRRGIDADAPLLVDRQLRTRAAAPAFLAAFRRLRLGRLLHAARLEVRFHIRLDIRPHRGAFEPGDLVVFRHHRTPQIRVLRQSFQQQGLQLGARKTVDVLGQNHAQYQSDSRPAENLIIVPMPRLLPLFTTN